MSNIQGVSLFLKQNDLGLNQGPQMTHLLKLLTFYNLQLFSLKHEPKISRGNLEYLLQMSFIQMKALLNVGCKVIDYVCTFLWGD